MLRRLSRHPHAPIFRDHSGPSLTTGDLALVRSYMYSQAGAEPEIRPFAGRPAWLEPWLEMVLHDVPFYRAQNYSAKDFAAIQPVRRSDLHADITRFVPDSQSLEGLILFSSSGTSGVPLAVPSHPRVAALYLHYHTRALLRAGVELSGGADTVAVALVGCQKHTFTYASVLPLLDEAGLVKLNLAPSHWKHPDDRVRYLDDIQPQLISGDPVSLAALAELPLAHRPRALLSTAMALSPAFRSALEARFGCPVVDVYSMTEAGPIATWSPRHEGFLLLQNRLFVEILDSSGRPVPEGGRGEITLTGGFNSWLPLIRYRTGDYAALRMSPEGPVLTGLEGRPPVRFRGADGTMHNNIDVSHALAHLALSRYALHQDRRGSFTLSLPARDPGIEQAACASLEQLLGRGIKIRLRTITAEDKVIQYTSDLKQDVIHWTAGKSLKER